MKHLHLDESLRQLQDAGEQLQRTWQQTTEFWKDSAARNLEEEHLRRLFSELTSAMIAIRQLSEVSDAAQRNCFPEVEQEF